MTFLPSHGVANFPLPKTNATGAFTLAITAPITDSPHFSAAFTYCKTLVPSGNQGPTITPADEADHLKAVASMRSHGFPGPDNLKEQGALRHPGEHQSEFDPIRAGDPDLSTVDSGRSPRQWLGWRVNDHGLVPEAVAPVTVASGLRR
jgi:hypothetical protein